jgi:hypothetical protein
MKTWDIVFLGLNILVTIVSIVGAVKSIRYFKKSKHITIYAQTNQSFNELEEMLRKLPEALAAASRTGKGYSPENAVQETGTAMANHYSTIMKAIPTGYFNEFCALQKTNTSDVEQYINSLIDGTAIIESEGRKMLGRDSFDKCQEQLRAMQEFLKKKISDEEEKLK